LPPADVSTRGEFERRRGSGQWHGGPIAAIIDTVGDYVRTPRHTSDAPSRFIGCVHRRSIAIPTLAASA
jgi:hypothetical protein